MKLSLSLRFVLPLATLVAAAADEQAPLVPTDALDTYKKFKPSPYSKHELLHLHKKLVETESITGNEEDVGEWLSHYLVDHGLAVEQQFISKDRFNVFAYPPKHRETKVLVTSHIDTVPPFWDYERRNSTGKAKGKEIWGRGSVDAKACVAAQTTAVLALLEEKRIKEGDVSLLFVVGEEKDGIGMKEFSKNKPTNYTAAIFGEPTEGALATGHKGILGWRISVKGKAAHSGYPELGLSANELLIDALNLMLELAPRFPKSKKYGASTLNVGRIDGGVAANVVPEHATADFALRIAAGTIPQIRLMITSQLEPLKRRMLLLGGQLDLQWTIAGYGTVGMDADIPGFDTITVNYGTDVPNLDGDHKRYLYGPGSILVAHSDHEHLKVKELRKAVEDYQRIILHALDRT